ncbi:hypothetical protein [Synechococcus sp. PCC 7336]|uniref:hypothetical protein n=1 Tax=Synechococcus sp. PCC 7336 TaxID=195250 RepID=UPI00034AC1B2|nr:hypothetical protein [Synechococcus sp. PCC 7336]
MAAISVQRYDLYLQATRLLHRYRQLAVGLHPTGVEVVLAIQFARDRMPWVGDTRGLALSAIAQTICDPFYTKSHPKLPCFSDNSSLVWPLFNQDPEGVAQPILPQAAAKYYWERRWLKACNAQAGIGCHASSSKMWQDAEFLNSDRDVCPLRFYDGTFPMTVDRGRQRCRFDDRPCGWQSGFPKMLQVLGSGPEAEVFRTDWSEAMWAMLVPVHQPVPVYPLIVALYFGSELLCQRREAIAPEQLAADLDLDSWHLRRVFDLDPNSAFNQSLLQLAAQSETLSDAIPHPGETFHLSGWSIPKLLPQPTGGHILLDPDEPPTFKTSGLPAGSSHGDPLVAERRRRRQLERTPAHNELLRQFRRWFRLAGIEVREDRQFFDFLAVKDNRVLLAEVKLLYHQDVAESIQELVGQLFYYERFAVAPWTERGFTLLKAAVVDRPPLGDYITFLSDLGIATYWLTEEGKIDGSEEALRLLRQMQVAVRPDPERLETDA